MATCIAVGGMDLACPAAEKMIWLKAPMFTIKSAFFEEVLNDHDIYSTLSGQT